MTRIGGEKELLCNISKGKMQANRIYFPGRPSQRRAIFYGLDFDFIDTGTSIGRKSGHSFSFMFGQSTSKCDIQHFSLVLAQWEQIHSRLPQQDFCLSIIALVLQMFQQFQYLKCNCPDDQKEDIRTSQNFFKEFHPLVQWTSPLL